MDATRNPSSGHYDVYIQMEQDINNVAITAYKMQENESLKENKTARKRGRPRKRKPGRPKTSDKSRAEQMREANRRYRLAHPEVVRNCQRRYDAKRAEARRSAVKCYTDTDPEVHRAAVKHCNEKKTIVRRSLKLKYAKNKISDFNVHTEKQKRLQAERILKWVLERVKDKLTYNSADTGCPSNITGQISFK